MEMLILSNSDEKLNIVKRFGQPVKYILNCLENNIEVTEFDLINAKIEWESVQNKKPVAYATEDHNGKLKDLRLKLNVNDDPYTMVKLYKE